ncbi:MAG: ArsC family (seleno)protein [Phycisphaerae bacterium]
MAKRVAWYYHRRSCETCRKSQAYLDSVQAQVAERVTTDEQQFDRDAALALARGLPRVVSIRGRSVTEFEMRKSPPDDETLARALLGPFGNLRAPALRMGTTFVVGFNDDAYARLFGKAPRRAMR